MKKTCSYMHDSLSVNPRQHNSHHSQNRSPGHQSTPKRPLPIIVTPDLKPRNLEAIPNCPHSNPRVPLAADRLSYIESWEGS